MYKKLLTKKFFQDNPYSENSVQRFIYSMLLYEGIEDAANEILMKQVGLSDERLIQITREKELIQSEQNPEEIFQLLRKKIDVINRDDLIKKALEFEEVLLPMVIEKLMRSYHDIFIENSIQLLARSHKDFTQLLKEKYAEIRSPYVQSLVCLILGLRGEENTIPWIQDRFFELKNLYPGETYDQGPLLALHELNCRFYDK
ncbi:hypothetical protein MFMK1_001291 [Metallumcola ferriviriculae]|uniref:Uncharacterized protein n=1 Tax=Metallumcola ferriviriculae TaxID=3039180 RepID=A0AAU0UM96_9FIRM|nr:hypothetical protein MFMK1_001291 [Desulfitibacteraceae bacterium MK1]